MPILLPEGLPARHTLESEGIDVLDAPPHRSGGPRPLRVALINLMPRKAVTEAQIARLLGATPRPVELTLAIPDQYVSGSTPAPHLGEFYTRWSAIREHRYDGLIVTGAPVEQLPFEDVTYWPELTQIFDWASLNVGRSYYICWAGQAALFHHHGVPKHALPGKRFGVYRQTILRPDHPLFDGLDGHFPVPVSRHTEVRIEDLPRNRGLAVLAASPETGLCMVEDPNCRAVYNFNHLEYDANTLADEYQRDRQAGLPVEMPAHYYPSDDPSSEPANTWQPHARHIFRNWLHGIEPRWRRSGMESSAA